MIDPVAATPAGPAPQPAPGPQGPVSSRVLSEEECVERLVLATVGRVGFVTPSGLQILPVNVSSSGTSLMLDTTPNSSLSQLAEMGREVTVEIDQSALSTGQAWSVLMRGTITKLDDGGRLRRDAMSRQVEAWPGESCSQALEFTPRSYSGRLVQHEPGREGTDHTPSHRRMLQDQETPS